MPRRGSREPELVGSPRLGDWAAASRRLALRHSIARLVLSGRASRAWSQAELARRAGTTQARVSDIENAVGNVRLDTLERLAEALGLALEVRPSGRAVRGARAIA